MIVDFHTHILPGIDDGSTSADESIAMLKAEWDQGIRHVVATPHFYPHRDYPQAFFERRNRSENALREKMSRHANLPLLEVGAEVAFFRGISESDQVSQLTIGKKCCILIEMPPPPWTDTMYRELEQLYTRQGLTPVIAHIDRYIAPFKSREILNCLSDLPVFVQANAAFILNRNTSGKAIRMLQRNQIHLLGSDCHNLTQRPPNLGDAVRKIKKSLSMEVLSRIEHCQALVLM